MKNAHVILGIFIICCLVRLSYGKSLGDDKSFSEDRLRCPESNEDLEYERSGQNSYSDYNRPLHSDRFSARRFDYNQKRSLLDDATDKGILEKRQVGVIYRDDKPIGILQPYQRSYRFIPVNGENAYEPEIDQDQVINKREINEVNAGSGHLDLDESYPSILTNFKIYSKLDQKRSDAFDDNVRNLRSTIRKLRSSNSRNSEHFEEELKNILDDMGLIEDDEVHAEKREISENDNVKNEDDSGSSNEDSAPAKDRNKRDENCNDDNAFTESNLLPVEEMRKGFRTADEESKEKPYKTRRKRQKEDPKPTNTGDKQIVENLKDSGDLMLSGNKSPLATSLEVEPREVGNKEEFEDEGNNDYEKRVERKIQDKINSLKEEVKREIEVLKAGQTDDDLQRRKRQVLTSLLEEEPESLNPVKNPENELKPLIRKRRSLEEEYQPEKASTEAQPRIKKDDVRQNRGGSVNVQRDEEDGGELLGGDDLEDNSFLKRQTFSKEPAEYSETDQQNSGRLQRRRRFYDDNDYFYEDAFRGKRDNYDDGPEETFRADLYSPYRSFRLVRPRFRRRISEEQPVDGRPQQLSDMSDLDLFGALPKGYSGELSRYKRVKRK